MTLLTLCLCYRGEFLNLGGDYFKTNKRSSFYAVVSKKKRERLTKLNEETEVRKNRIWKIFFAKRMAKYRSILPRDVIESPFLEVSKAEVDNGPRNLL